jgi:predicted methyltransferase
MKNFLKYLISINMAFVFLCLSVNSFGLTREQAEAIVNAADRTPDERLDERRNPVEFLLFTGVETGMKVADIDGGRGWTTELMGRAVGPTGVIYSRTNPDRLDGLKERLSMDALSHAIPVGRDMVSPLPPEANDLDIVVVLFSYHHLITQADEARAEAYANVLAALKPGGSFIVVDTQAKDGSGHETGSTIHRLAQDLMRRELEDAGFKFVDSGNFIQNPDDPLDISGREVDGTPSAFVHRYVRPE